MTVKTEESKKVFLSDKPNEFGSLAWCAYSCYDEPTDESEGDLWVVADLRITDCSRPITLEFYTSKEEDAKGRLDKLDKMIGQLYAFRTAYTKACHETWGCTFDE